MWKPSGNRILSTKVKVDDKTEPLHSDSDSNSNFSTKLPIVCDKRISSKYFHETEENSNLSCGFLPDKVVINLPNRFDLRKTQQPSP